jgi:sec-independent protein translocase protein TatA
MSLGWPELLVILTIIVIIFGAGKLPEVGGAVGKGIKEFGAAAREKEGNDQEPETLRVDSREKPAQP